MKLRRIDWYHDDWLAGTARLNAFEVAVYITVINLIYSEGDGIDRDDRDLARRLQLRVPHITRIVDALKAKRKLIEDGAKLYCRRCVDELERARNRHESASKNATERWKNRALAYAGALGGAHPHARDNQQSSVIKQQSSKDTRASRASSNEAFDRWYEGYPRKDAKGAARKAFPGALKKTSLDELIAGVKRYITNKPPDQAYCHPATWLNQERWLDVPATNNGSSHANGRLDDAGLHDGPTEPAPKVAGWELPMDRPH